VKWTSRGRSQDLEDRRAQGRRFGGSGGRMIPIGLGGLALLVVLSLATGENFLTLLDPGQDATSLETDAVGPLSSTPDEERLVDFVSFVLDDAQDTWSDMLGSGYRRAKLVLFRDAVESACGLAESASGPFYCPGDEKVYIDLGFYEELRQRFGASGDFAQAYVLAHEIGHHVQKILGTEAGIRRAQGADPARVNELSVGLELQADCYAGIWGHSTAQRQILEHGDVEEALNAAAAIGDDRIQRMSTGRVMPDRFTHGSSAQRVDAFRRGLADGRLASCDMDRMGAGMR
jgi:uncharacterized protein